MKWLLAMAVAAGVLTYGALMMGAGPASAPSQPSQDQRKDQSMNERKGAVTMKGNPLTLLGSEVKVGQQAPDFVALANDMSEVKLAALRGKVVLLAAVPSLDTGVCSRETHRFNEEAANLGADVKIVTVSMDLPFAQKRWCGAEGVQNLQTVSDHREASFGLAYGVLIKELRLLARSVFVVDRQGKIVYAEIVKEVTDEPNYEAALAAVKELTQKAHVGR